VSHFRSELNIPNIHFILVIVTFSLLCCNSVVAVAALSVVAEFELPRTQIRHRLHAGLLLSPLRKTSSYVKSQLIRRKNQVL
jgi:hypothetical protein